MSLRKHQYLFKETIDGIIAGSGIGSIYCHVTPGGGKSILPIIAGKLIEAGLADKLMWIAPRLSLTDQAEREFINPYFRQLLGHRLQIRSSTNENNPCRGLDGFSTTYQAVGLDEGILEREFKSKRYILIADEPHHIALDSLWHQKIAPLYGLAAYRIFMSGTFERGDGSRIAFLPYRQNGCGMVPDLKETPERAVIRYSREDALRERAIIPLSFHLSDGQASWTSNTGRQVNINSIDRMSELDANKALYTALHTEFADELLFSGLQHFLEHRRRFPRAKCLIVTSDIEQAKRHAGNLKAMGLRARYEIATSDDSAKALKVINAMKKDEMDVLVTVAMAYEGLDIPAISHIICLTRIRSNPWIIQMAARANRIDKNGGSYDEQVGYIFAPADPLFKTIVEKIEREQLAAVRDKKARAEKEAEPDDEKGDGFCLQPTPGGIVPLSSKLTGRREVLLSGNGQNGHFVNLNEMPERTSSETEQDLLNQIDSHIRSFSFQNRYHPKRINYEVFQYFGRKRQEMTIKELESCLKWVKSTYPINHIRGTGSRRVAAKAAAYPCEWR